MSKKYNWNCMKTLAEYKNKEAIILKHKTYLFESYKTKS